jgi:hypothetical protein
MIAHKLITCVNALVGIGDCGDLIEVDPKTVKGPRFLGGQPEGFGIERRE